jgi:hypothetical protein
MRADIKGMAHLPPRRRPTRLTAEQVRRIVEAAQPGYLVPANLEKHPFCWRLRFTFNNPNGGIIRRCITIPDEKTAKWVDGYLQAARAKWRRDRREKKRTKAGEL